MVLLRERERAREPKGALCEIVAVNQTCSRDVRQYGEHTGEHTLAGRSLLTIDTDSALHRQRFRTPEAQ